MHAFRRAAGQMVTDYPHPNIMRGSDLRLTVCLDMLLPAQEE